MDDDLSMKQLCRAFDALVGRFNSELEKGFEQIDTKEAGEVTDMIKDLAEAKHHCWESCYCEKIVKAMEKAGDDKEWMYREGYIPPSDEMGKRRYERGYLRRWMREPNTFESEMNDSVYRDGYTPNRSMNTSRDSIRHETSEGDGRYGKPYREYLDARRHYTESKSPRDKEEMEMHANEHMMDAMGTIREIYKSAEPDLRKRMKSDLTKLIGEMPT